MASDSKLSAKLIDELQTALAHGTVARRVDTLRRVTDLFVGSSTGYSARQLAVFDDVYDCLLNEIEASAKRLLAERLGPIDGAPPRVIRTLAFDDQVDIAAPVLRSPTASMTAA